MAVCVQQRLLFTIPSPSREEVNKKFMLILNQELGARSTLVSA